MTPVLAEGVYPTKAALARAEGVSRAAVTAEEARGAALVGDSVKVCRKPPRIDPLQVPENRRSEAVDSGVQESPNSSPL